MAAYLPHPQQQGPPPPPPSAHHHHQHQQQQQQQHQRLAPPPPPSSHPSQQQQQQPRYARSNAPPQQQAPPHSRNFPPPPQQQQQHALHPSQHLHQHPAQNPHSHSHPHPSQQMPTKHVPVHPAPPISADLASLPSVDASSSYLPFPPSSSLFSSSSSSPSFSQPFTSTGLQDVDEFEPESDELALPGASAGNRGNKLKKGARWVRRGKAVAWGMGSGEREIEDRLRARLKLTLSHHLPPSSLLSSSKEEGIDSPSNKLSSSSFSSSRPRPPLSRSPSPPLLPHLATDSAGGSCPPSPPLLSASLSHLLSPPRSFTEIVTSPAMRHTFASAHLEDALGRTAGELIEGEMGVLKALGRFFEECRERGVVGGVGVGTVAAAAAAARTQEENEVEENEASSVSAQVPDAGRAEEGGENGQMPPMMTTTTMMDGVLQQSQQAPPHPSPPPQDPNNPYAPPPPPPPPPPPAHLHHHHQPHLSPLEQLFITPGGLQITLPPNAAAPPQATTTEDGLPVGGGPAGGGVLTLSVEHQKEALYRGMDALGELLADSREYVERLEEVRERLAGVGRGRQRVWREVKERCFGAGESGGGELGWGARE